MSSSSTNKAKLIAEIYEVVLKPERYDSFMGLWERHLSKAIDAAKPFQENTSSFSNYINDPELEAHFQRAYEILEKMGREGKAASTPEQFAAKKSDPTFFIAANKEIIYGNKSAEKLLDGITSLKGLLPLLSKKDYEKLAILLLGMDRPDAAGQIHVLSLNAPSDKPASTKDKEQLFLAKAMRFSRNQPTLLCVYAMGIDWDKGLDILLADSFGLSSSELQVGRGLCEGKTLDQIASERKRSVHTMRSQVKSMLRKTGTSSQADLVRIIVTLASFGRGPSLSSLNVLKRLDHGSQTMVPVAGGRLMPVHQIGAPDGDPVLFIHGMLNGIAICKSVTKLLAKNNIRLIAPMRPSFSDSPAAYKIKTAPDEFALDIRHIMDHLEIDCAPIAGHMAGSLYAFSAAAILPERISAILNISGVVPLISMHQLSSISARQRVVAWTARFAPNLLPTIIRAGISQIDSGLETEFMNALYAKGSKDREVAENNDISIAIYAGYQFAIAQGHRAFEIDTYHLSRNWSDYVKQTHQRVILAHGALDLTIEIDSVRKFANLYDNIELIEHEDAGQLLFHQKPRAIISMLRKMLDTN